MFRSLCLNSTASFEDWLRLSAVHRLHLQRSVTRSQGVRPSLPEQWRIPRLISCRWWITVESLLRMRTWQVKQQQATDRKPSVGVSLQFGLWGQLRSHFVRPRRPIGYSPWMRCSFVHHNRGGRSWSEPVERPEAACSHSKAEISIYLITPAPIGPISSVQSAVAVLLDHEYAKLIYDTW